MQVVVTFRHMSPSDPLRTHAIEKVQHLKRYFQDAADTHVVLSVEKHMHKAEINMSVHGLRICSDDISSDMYNSIERAVERVETQVKRYHSRLIAHRPKEGARMKLKYKLLENTESLEQERAANLFPTIVETKELEARPMLLDEAVMQMDLIHDEVLMFLNSKTDQLNVLYRKKGNQYGLIETNH